MKRIFIGLTLFVAAALPTFARWGESYEQCIERYGNPKKVEMGADNLPAMAQFEFSGIKIRAYMSAKVVNKIMYTRIDGKSLTSKELNLILSKYNRAADRLFFVPMNYAATLDGHEDAATMEKMLKNSIIYQTWIRYRDGQPQPNSLMAIYNRDLRLLLVKTVDQVDKTQPAKKAPKKTGLKGL